MAPRSKIQNEEKRKASIQAIANSAMLLFMEQGYLNVTIEQIAKGAGISKGLMYNYFSGKEELLSHIMNQISFEMYAYFDKVQMQTDPVKKVKVILQVFFQLLVEKADFWRTIMPVITQKGVSEKMQSQLEAMLKVFATDFERMFKAAKVKNAEFEAYQLGAILDGIAWHYFFLFKEGYPLKQMEKELISKYSKLLKNGK